MSNVHARRDKGASWDPNLRFMSNHLVAAEPGVVTLDSAYLAGSAWVCLGTTAADCSVHPLKPSNEEHAATPRIVLLKGDPERAYDGVFGLGPVSPSPPAVAGAQAPETPAPAPASARTSTDGRPPSRS